MNFFETEIARCERRIAKIEESPDPTRLRSTKLYYQIERDLRCAQLEWWRQNRTFLAGPDRLQLLAKALGSEWLDMGMMADKIPRDKVNPILQAVSQAGYPTYLCERTVMCLGMYLTSQDLAAPAAVVLINRGCYAQILF